MKTLSILLKKSYIETFYLSQSSLEYIHDYIDYLLYPYKRLGFFNYNTYTECCNPIDGKVSPKILLNVLKKYVESNQTTIIHSIFEQNSMFLNSESLNFYLSTDEYCEVSQNIIDYFLFFTCIHD